MLQYIVDKLESLEFRILGGIFCILFLAVAMVLFGVYTYQRDRLLAMAVQQATSLSEVIVAGLRSSMLQNDRTRTMQDIETILRVAGNERISVLNPAGRIAMTTDPALAGKVLDRKTHPPCQGCHATENRPRRTAVQDLHGEKTITTVTAIRNEPVCHGCHGEGQGPIGFLLVESSLAETTALLRSMAQRIALTGLFAFFLGVLLLSAIVARFFITPLRKLQQGFSEVGRGNFAYWVEVQGGGEMGYMADSFNVMNRAIGRYVDEIRGKSEEIASHYTIVDSLSQSIERKVLKEVVVDLLVRLLHADCAALALTVESYPNLFEIVKSQRRDRRHYHAYFNTDSGQLNQCALTRDDLLKWQAGEYPAISYIRDEAKLLMPLSHEGLAIGVVSVVKASGETFRPLEKKIIPILSHHISLSFANAQLYHLAITDGLTTLYSKRYFEKKVQDAISRFHASKRGFCILLLDPDHFRAVNDEYGPSAGDKVLVRVADLIRISIRHGDMPFRYGGEEFMVLLHDDGLENAVRTAERIRLAVEKTALIIENIPPLHQTVSIGIACFPHHFSTVRELASAADLALNEAKRRGRNQVVVYCPNSPDFSTCY
ncbi:MAG: sensor domain-containing diguanylate cyclase [Desulfobulbaceae bacterium]